MMFRRILTGLLAGVFLGTLHAADPSVASASFKVMSYNVHNFLLVDRNGDGLEDDPKPEDEKQALYTIIAEEAPDILALIEVGGLKFFEEIQDGLRGRGCNYPFSEWIEGTDHARHITLLSRYPIVARHPHTREEYRAGNQMFRVSRGFIEADLQVAPGLRVKVEVAHLKSKRTVSSGPIFADAMRVEEARLLRQCVNDGLAAHPREKLVLMGDFNDTPDSPSIRLILADMTHPLFDLHAINAKGYDGTFYYRPRKRFERIDYLLVSAALREDYIVGSARLRDDRLAWKASDHFPVMAQFRIASAP